MLQIQQSLPGQRKKGSVVPMTPSRTIVFTKTAEDTERMPSTSARSALTGCPWRDVKAMLRDVGLRPTRQRMALGWILFGKGDRHITAEMLYEEATKIGRASCRERVG